MCKYNSNKCYYSCQRSTTERQQELEALLNFETPKECPQSSHRGLLKGESDEQVKEFQGATTTSLENEFLSAGLWLTTVIFLALSSFFALLCVFFSMLNIFWRPFRWFAIQPLFLSNLS